MNHTLKIVGFGLIMWLIPFIVSLIIYPLKISFDPLFESIMPVVITLTVVLLSAALLQRCKYKFFKRRHYYRGKLVFDQHFNRSNTFYPIESNADEFYKLYDGYRSYLSYNTSCYCRNGLYGR